MESVPGATPSGLSEIAEPTKQDFTSQYLLVDNETREVVGTAQDYQSALEQRPSDTVTDLSARKICIMTPHEFMQLKLAKPN